MLKELIRFLHLHWDRKTPLLLGYSGGPDSKALLYGLLDAGCNMLHLAHVDHGWRAESAEEALLLQKEAETLGLPFYSTRLTPPSGGNQEAAARDERLAFFHSLCKSQGPFQAVLLAHHLGDVAETVLKRVLEGAHLPFLGGMEPVSEVKGLLLWRPLLSVKRQKILAFLKEKNLTGFEDATNFDPAYLRARMRRNILPWLSEHFGKEVSGNLALLSKRCLEYKDYLDRKIASCEGVAGPWGVFYAISHLERIEARHLLQSKGRQFGLRWRRDSLEQVLDAALSKLPNFQFSSSVFVDRGLVFFLSASAPKPGSFPLELRLGEHRWGDWIVKVSLADDPLPSFNWKTVWSGRFSVNAPQGAIALPEEGNRFGKQWNLRKIPVFLRRQVPVLWKNGIAVQEFLGAVRFRQDILGSAPLFKLSFSTACEVRQTN
jgi:tRNA(Ile)-lysidine synthase